MLVGAGVRVYHGPVRAYGAALAAAVDRGTIKPGGRRNATGGKYGIPSTYRHPGAWVWPQKPGTLGSSLRATGTSDLTGSGAQGVNGEALLAGLSDVSATGQLIVSAVAAIIGSGDISNAEARAFLLAAATLAGSGDLVAALDALGAAAAAIEGSSTLSETLRASGTMAATIDVAATETLTAAGVASAVWDTPQARFLYAVGHNRVVTDPVAGTFTVYDVDDSTILYTADLWEDADGTVAYTGTGAQRRDRLA